MIDCLFLSFFVCEVKVEFTLSWKRIGSLVIDVSIKRDSLLVYVLKFFGILAGRCGSVVVRDRD